MKLTAIYFIMLGLLVGCNGQSQGNQSSTVQSKIQVSVDEAKKLVIDDMVQHGLRLFVNETSDGSGEFEFDTYCFSYFELANGKKEIIHTTNLERAEFLSQLSRDIDVAYFGKEDTFIISLKDQYFVGAQALEAVKEVLRDAEGTLDLMISNGDLEASSNECYLTLTSQSNATATAFKMDAIVELPGFKN